MEVIAVRHHQTVGDVERGGVREQRRGVTVGPEAEVHEVDRRCRRDGRVVRVGGGLDGVARPAQSSARRGDAPGRAARPGHSLVRLGIVDRHPPLVAEVHVDPLQARSTAASASYARRCGAPARQRDRRRRRLGDQRRERVGDVVDDTDLTVHGVMIRTWSARRYGCTRARPANGVTGAARGSSTRSGRSRPRCRRAVARIDLGCGAGLHLPSLPRPVVALDAAHAMVRLARDEAPDAWPVQADLEALPFRRGALAAGWARASYLHVPNERLPAALADLHRRSRSAPGAPRAARRGRERILPDDDFPGPLVRSVDPGRARRRARRCRLRGRACAVDDDEPFWLEARVTRARTLPDTVGPGMRLLVCGLNPSVYSADVGPRVRAARQPLLAGGAGRGARQRSPTTRRRALRDDRRRHDRPGEAGDGPRRRAHAATSTAPGWHGVERMVAWLQPGAVCFVGLAGWRAAVDRKAVAGVQPHGSVGARPT